MPTILDGKALSEKILSDLKIEIEQKNLSPKLAVILAGEDPASEIYVSVKEKACNKLGIISEVYKFPSNTTEESILKKIQELNEDISVNAILVQLPLPSGINKNKIINAVAPQKDVDGFTSYNTGCLTANTNPFSIPCTPKGIIRILDDYNININGKHAVIIGRSDIVGKPVSIMLLNRNATVTICHSKTKNLSEITKQADILISAVGKPKFVTKNMVKNNAVIIDVGISRINGKLVGDVDFDDVCSIVSYITPVPKGVGPMTIASLMENTVELFKQQNSLE